jgi:hypothetical protein
MTTAGNDRSKPKDKQGSETEDAYDAARASLTVSIENCYHVLLYKKEMILI